MRGRRPDVGEEYLSQVAHELRGSLNAILGWAEFLRRTDCEDAARVRAAETIIRHARQQSGMVAELLDIWRLATGTLIFTVSPFDVRALVEEAIAAVQPMAQSRGLRVESHADPSQDRRARGDVKRLSQALVALLSNAVHFAPEGTAVQVSFTTDGANAHLTIRGEGPGVPPAALPYLFERTRPSDRGSARASFRLGLSFARDVITRHGGSIEAESAGDVSGLTFRLVLPLDAQRADTTPPSTALMEAVPVDGSVAELDGLRVLLVDDEPDAREALTGILELHGAVVRMAGSAADAISALQTDAFDVLLADIGMPGVDGYDLIRYVRGLESGSTHQVPAAAVTAFASDADRRRALDAGFQVHISKPVDPAALVATVAVLGRARAIVR
jgi:CheY-like chemotaxis protein